MISRPKGKTLIDGEYGLLGHNAVFSIGVNIPEKLTSRVEDSCATFH
jgi:hypothetical protein